jgi:hypothetical protein
VGVIGCNGCALILRPLLRKKEKEVVITLCPY